MEYNWRVWSNSDIMQEAIKAIDCPGVRFPTLVPILGKASGEGGYRLRMVGFTALRALTVSQELKGPSHANGCLRWIPLLGQFQSEGGDRRVASRETAIVNER